MKIKVMLAEDERLAREELEFLLGGYDDLILCASVTNGKELLEKYKDYSPDVIFLDIQMPELEGMQVAQQLKSTETSPLIVFTTAYDQYAVEAFGLNAIDYLLKPFDEDRLKEAVNRVRKEMLNNKQSKVRHTQPKEIDTLFIERFNKISKLLLDDGERLSVIDPQAIYYVMREERVVRIFTLDKDYQTKLTLQELEEKLSPFHFFRSHRSYLVNLHYVEEILPWFNGAYNLILKDKPKTKIPVSRSSAKELLQKLQM